ncbi:MAG TPA: E3 ubiquitin ligase family protein [Rubrobacteraceae bacterium]|nr:E3 ubiquitin ligase family protein [Rubrobacteraceae bacterium]
MSTFLILLLFAVIFLAAGGALLYFRRSTQQKSGLMSQTETSSAADIGGLAPGTMVEVKGTLRCEEPLTSEIAGETCAYYTATVTREYLEEDHDDNDSSSDRRSEVLSQIERFAPFTVEDASGAVPIDAEEAEVDARQVVERFERDTDSGFSLGGIPIRFGDSERTIGYRYTESILPVNVPVYALGVVREDGKIGAPPSGDKEKRFIISYRSEEALGESLGKTTFWLGVGAIGAFVLGIVLLVIGLFVLIM